MLLNVDFILYHKNACNNINSIVCILQVLVLLIFTCGDFAPLNAKKQIHLFLNKNKKGHEYSSPKNES